MQNGGKEENEELIERGL